MMPKELEAKEVLFFFFVKKHLTLFCMSFPGIAAILNYMFEKRSNIQNYPYKNCNESYIGALLGLISC